MAETQQFPEQLDLAHEATRAAIEAVRRDPSRRVELNGYTVMGDELTGDIILYVKLKVAAYDKAGKLVPPTPSKKSGTSYSDNFPSRYDYNPPNIYTYLQ